MIEIKGGWMANILGIVLLSSAPTPGSLFVSSWGWAASACDEDNVTMWGLPEQRAESELISTNSEPLGGEGELSRGIIQLLSVISHLEKIVIFRSLSPTATGAKWICITTFVVYLSSVIAICFTSAHTFSAHPSPGVISDHSRQGLLQIPVKAVITNSQWPSCD